MTLEHTFRAERFDDAMAQVKGKLGADALIVSRRQVSRGRALDGGRPLVEIVAMAAAQAGAHPSEGSGRGDAALTAMLERRLVRGGVPEHAARAIAAHTGSVLDGEGDTDDSAMRDALAGALKSHLLFAQPIDGRVRAVALVGPTGAGKTTTIAKIAADAALVRGMRVGLISIDRYRIGGTEQLQRYADLIGIEMEVASDAHSLEIALRRMHDAELVLIDTAGRSPRDIDALSAMSETLQGVQEPVEVHLCIPTATRERELEVLAERYSLLRPTRLISTKVDEAVCCGSVVAAQMVLGLPLGYLTTGQRVPEDIIGATPRALSGLLTGEEVPQ